MYVYNRVFTKSTDVEKDERGQVRRTVTVHLYVVGQFVYTT